MSEMLQTAAKTLAVAALLADAGDLTIADIMERLGLSRAAAHRTVATLLKEGWAEQVGDSRRYRLGLRMVELGGQALQHLPVYAIGMPAVERLASTLSANTHLAVPFEDAMLFVARVSITDLGIRSAPNAMRTKFHGTAAGRVALAYLPELEARLGCEPLAPRTPFTVTDPALLKQELAVIRSRGYAIVARETYVHTGTVAAPVFDYTGKYVASVGVTANIERFDEAWTSHVVTHVLECTRNLSLTLGFRGAALAEVHA